MPTNTIGPSAFLSTALNSRIVSYDLLAERIFFQLGSPLINLEIACTAAYDHIAYAIEMYTKFTPGTEELMVFDSDLYTRNQGIKMDTLINYTPELSAINPLSSTFQSGWDDDLEVYRKVIDVTSFNVGSNTGVNTLFTIEHSLAQQMQFAYNIGGNSFDMISWHILKDWLKTREKLFALQPYFRFDSRTQVLRITPDPQVTGNRYFACVACRVERPIKDIVKERWVMEYAKALIKMSIAHTRGKFQGTALFGSGTLQYETLMSQGMQEKKDLEDQIIGGKQEDQEPAGFFLG